MRTGASKKIIQILFTITILTLASFALKNNSQILNNNNIQEAREINSDVLFNNLTDESKVRIRINDATITAEVAKSPTKQQRGLMHRAELGNEDGMIFIYNSERNVTFWMSNTYIPLDIIYINSEYKIVNIHKNTKTNQTQEVYPSEKPVQYVLEVNSSWTDIHKVDVGDKVIIDIVQ